ncbi:MAG: EAL domain-containing protein [Rhodospirillales bacterium]|nr:EAL domain-containing protein [Rhodospirillales bacterium]
MSSPEAKPRKARKTRSQVSRLLTSSPTQIWKSRISWRITLVVFLTIMAVQAGILSMTIRDYENSRLNELVETARSSIAPLINSRIMDLLAPPIPEESLERLFATTKVKGVAVYSSDLNLIRTYGAPTVITVLDVSSLYKTHYDGNWYEVVFRPQDLRRPFVIVARIDAETVPRQVYSYVEQTILIMLLMSAFVTSVLMVALGHWLLEPILFMRQTLLTATENPENPKIPDSPFDPNDEIGGAIALAHRLIRQNAENMRQIKGAAEDQIHKLAYYDSLTGLPNRTLFVQKLSDQARPDGIESQPRFAVITLDLDHFKDINDSMGHNVGDAILRAIGKRLRAALPEQATVARTGEDEFAIMTPLRDGATTAREVGERIINVIRSHPFSVFNENFQIRASIGVATFPDDAVDPDQVLKNADIALNRAKEDGRDSVREYSEDFDRAVQHRFQMLRDLRDALESNQLSLYYQPQFDLRSGRLIGAEALLRWFKPDNSKQGGTFISPADFIPVAEQSGLIVPIGEWVMQQACIAAAKWTTPEGHGVRVAVNLSGAQFHQSDIVAYVDRVLQEAGLPPTRLELEVTESVFMDDIQHTVQTLQRLHGLGVEIAIDDFGTGYSSLSYLRQFPIDRLKIDQSFIRNALNNPDDASIARTIVGLGHSLNLKVIAEGVETKDHENFLKGEGCDEVQGYRYARPMPGDKFLEFLAGYNGDLSVFDKA